MALNGVVGSFLGSFEGWVGVHHLPDRNYSLDEVQLKKKMKGRVVWVDTPAKLVGVAQSKHVVCGNSQQFGDVEIGDKFTGKGIGQPVATDGLGTYLGGCYVVALMVLGAHSILDVDLSFPSHLCCHFPP